ncbi:MAG: Gfo/Idh/MocA family oxidoreductase [Gemmatimonadota bacterium]|nr:Gfo/Idh/MocA family oxidoreductase [Gemmatimonadota bacterium]
MTDGAARRPLRATIVGAGLMGRWHAHAVARAGHSVIAVVDTDRDRATAVARAHSGASVFATLHDAPRSDVVHVCTPLASHVELAMQAINRGSHVIAEKPLATSAAETAMVLERATAARLLVVPVHQFPFQRGVRQAKAALADIGRLLHVDFTACTAGAAGRPDDEQDRIALEVLPHPLSLLASLVSSEIAEVAWSVAHTRPGELRASGVLAGSSVSVLISTGGRPTANQLRLIGERGSISIDLYHGFSVATHGRTTRTGKVTQPFVNATSHFGAAAGNLARRAAAREPAYPGLRELVREFYDAAATGGAAPISPSETVNIATTLETIQRMMVSA